MYCVELWSVALLEQSCQIVLQVKKLEFANKLGVGILNGISVCVTFHSLWKIKQ